MNYLLAFGLFFLSTIAAWECTGHMTIMQIALFELSNKHQQKLNQILGFMSSGVSNFKPIEAACFHHDMEGAAFTALSLWNSCELPFYDGVDPKDSQFVRPIMNSSSGIVI